MKSLVEYIVNEDAKDEMRVNDIITKSNGNAAKEENLAFNMAKAITDKSKAMRRYEAADKLLGKTHIVTVVFARRAAELGNNVAVPVAASASNTTVAEIPAGKAYVYSSTNGRELFENNLIPIIAKLRGNDWGSAFSNKVSKMTAEDQLSIATFISSSNDLWERYGYSYHGRTPLPKLSYAISAFTRNVMRNKAFITKELDLGNAKSDKSNPVHWLYEQERKEDLIAESTSIMTTNINFKQDIQILSDEDTLKLCGSYEYGDNTFAGVFNHYDTNAHVDYVILNLDEHDKQHIKNVVLKPSQQIFRVQTEKMKKHGYKPLVKLDLKTEMFYFLVDNDEDTPTFERKGSKIRYMKIRQTCLTAKK